MAIDIKKQKITQQDIQYGYGTVTQTRNDKDVVLDMIPSSSGILDVRDFGCKMDGVTDDSAAFTKACQSKKRLVVQNGTMALDKGVQYRGSNEEDIYITFYNSKVVLLDGNKAEAPFKFTYMRSVYIYGLNFDGNRNLVSGNNAGMLDLQNCKNVVIHNTTINDLRRFGINITGNDTENVRILNTRADNVGVLGTNTVTAALGEVIKVNDADNVLIDNLICTNTSKTGDGQMQKCFYCKNVTLRHFQIDNASPGNTYPSISNVGNDSYIAENIKITGDSQVCFEDNSNKNVTYRNIETDGRKALICSADRGALSDRAIDRFVAHNWKDSSFENLAFNVLGAKNIFLSNVHTNKRFNITRYGNDNNMRANDVIIDNCSFDTLFTLLVTGRLNIINTTITGEWQNSSDEQAFAEDVTFSKYTTPINSRLVRTSTSNTPIHISKELAASEEYTFYCPKNSLFSPFIGNVRVFNILKSNSANYGILDFDFCGLSNTSKKEIAKSNSNPQTNISITPSTASRYLKFKNTGSATVTMYAVISMYVDNIDSKIEKI